MMYAGIVAGGTGSRMGADIPKQFLTIDDKPILIHSIEKFAMVDRIDYVFVAVHKDWTEYTKELISKYISDKYKKNIIVIKAADDRNSSVFCIVDEIKKRFSINENDILLTHDAVRPFVTEKIIKDNIECIKTNVACTTAISAIDTILRSEDAQVVSDTLLRSELYHAQTPQTFKLNVLDEIYRTLSYEEKAKLTDTCSIFTIKGLPVNIVNGDISNIKITTPYDLKIAETIIKMQ